MSTAETIVTSAPTDDVIVEVIGLTKAFGDHVVLNDISLTIRENEFVALLGRSGGGKSTLLRLLEGLDTDYSGTIRVPQRRAVVFQEPRLLAWRKVWQNIVLGLDGHRSELRGRATEILNEVGLGPHADSWPATLSGGEAQRVGLARALVREPDLLLLDEPFGALDALTKLRLHSLLRALVRVHTPGVLLVTHDVDEATALADRVIVLDNATLILDAVVPVDDGSLERQLERQKFKTTILSALGVSGPELNTTAINATETDVTDRGRQ
ncbi:MAG: ABC transporter ATP-binding protein [Gordonia sp. (in: high G+C Gram-positive bacteria)]